MRKQIVSKMPVIIELLSICLMFWLYPSGLLMAKHGWLVSEYGAVLLSVPIVIVTHLIGRSAEGVVLRLGRYKSGYAMSTHLAIAEFLFYLFMSRQTADAIVGDLEEGYKVLHKRFGRHRANFWCWTQTVTSLGPILWAWVKKLSLKPVMDLIDWTVAKDLVGHESWAAALVELLKKVRFVGEGKY